jgi:hypothetical protein
MKELTIELTPTDLGLLKKTLVLNVSIQYELGAKGEFLVNDTVKISHKAFNLYWTIGDVSKDIYENNICLKHLVLNYIAEFLVLMNKTVFREQALNKNTFGIEYLFLNHLNVNGNFKDFPWKFKNKAAYAYYLDKRTTK